MIAFHSDRVVDDGVVDAGVVDAGVVDAGVAGPGEFHPGDGDLQPRTHLLPLVPPHHKWVTIYISIFIMIRMMILYC